MNVNFLNSTLKHNFDHDNTDCSLDDTRVKAYLKSISLSSRKLTSTIFVSTLYINFAKFKSDLFLSFDKFKLEIGNKPFYLLLSNDIYVSHWLVVLLWSEMSKLNCVDIITSNKDLKKIKTQDNVVIDICIVDDLFNRGDKYVTKIWEISPIRNKKVFHYIVPYLMKNVVSNFDRTLDEIFDSKEYTNIFYGEYTPDKSIIYFDHDIPNNYANIYLRSESEDEPLFKNVPSQLPIIKLYALYLEYYGTNVVVDNDIKNRIKEIYPGFVQKIDWYTIYSYIKYYHHVYKRSKLVTYDTDCILSFIIVQEHNCRWDTYIEPVLPKDKDIKITSLQKDGYYHNFINNVLFYRSGRPKNNIITFTQDVSNYIDNAFKNTDTDIYIVKGTQEIVKLDEDEDEVYIYYISDMELGAYGGTLYIPIIRYMIGMSGMYTSMRRGKEEYCGTFYYFEPDAPYLIRSDTTLVAYNKISACHDLGLSYDDIYQVYYDKIMNEELTQDMLQNGNITEEAVLIEYIKNNDLIDTKVSDIEDQDDIEGQDEQDEQDEQDTEDEQDPLTEGPEVFLKKLIIEHGQPKADPLEHDYKFYAFEDPLDQILCQLATKAGYDIVILKYMTGKNRIVTEVLDSRPRDESYFNIYYPPDLQI